MINLEINIVVEVIMMVVDWFKNWLTPKKFNNLKAKKLLSNI